MQGRIRALIHTTSLKMTIRDGTELSRASRRAYSKWIRCFLIALIDRNVMTSVVPEIDLARARNFLLGIEEHLFPLRDPTGCARNREEHGKHSHRETHRLINQAGVEVHVWIELALHEVFVFESDALALQSDFEERVLAHELEDFVSDVLDDTGARIVILVDAMAESHELDFAGFDALDEVGNFLDRANLHEHVQNFFVGAAVQRTVEGRDRRRRGGVGVHVGAADAADGVGGAVLLVVGMKDEQNVEGVLQGRVRSVFRFGGAKEHVEKVARIAKFVVGIDERHAQSVAIRECRDGGNLSDETISLLLARLRAEDVFRVVIESRKRGNGGDHHAHGMGVVMKAVQKFLDAFVDESVVRDVVGPILQLRGRRQFAMQEQIRGFQIGAFFREVFYWVTAITQDAGVAIDEGDFADAGCGVVEGRVVAHHAKFCGVNFDLAEVGGTDGVVGDGNLVRFAGAIVGDGERLAGRAGAFLLSRRRCGEWRVHGKILGGRGAVAALSLSLYTKGGAAGNWPKGRRKVHKRKGLVEEPGHGGGGNIPLDNSRYNEYYL